jgi:hypothetical protein
MKQGEGQDGLVADRRRAGRFRGLVEGCETARHGLQQKLFLRISPLHRRPPQEEIADQNRSSL